MIELNSILVSMRDEKIKSTLTGLGFKINSDAIDIKVGQEVFEKNFGPNLLAKVYRTPSLMTDVWRFIIWDKLMADVWHFIIWDNEGGFTITNIRFDCMLHSMEVVSQIVDRMILQTQIVTAEKFKAKIKTIL